MKPTKKLTSSSKTKRHFDKLSATPDRSPKIAKLTKSAVPARAKAKQTPTGDLSGLKPKKETRVEIKPAKGRPMLTWVGKKALRHTIAYPAQLVESFNAEPKAKKAETWTDWPKDTPQTGLLFHGDNKDVLAYLLANGFRGKVKLIYIDPPFDSGADYIRRVNLRGGTTRLESEGYTLGEQVQYSDIWTNDNYLQFIYERLLLLKGLLTTDGVICLHCDYRRSYHLRCLLDEVFGTENFIYEIVWQRTASRGDSKGFGLVHDTILAYATSENWAWNKQYEPHSEEFLDSHYTLVDEDGRRYSLDNPTAAGDGPSRYFWGELLAPPPGTHWRWSQDRINQLIADNRIVKTKSGRPRYKRYLDEMLGKAITSVWTDISPVNSQANEDTHYPTQKPEPLLERIISASTNPNDIVLDCFIGSGTTAAVAQKLGRRWIGADINKGAIQTTEKRLQKIIQEQFEESQEAKQIEMPIAIDLRAMAVGEGKEPYEVAKESTPAQLAFSVYRVNDYDLQIQHNEAFNLAVEHLGMTRTKTDAFFDGTLGRKLVKIVPFNHPVTPLDLEEVKRELKNRPEEERDIAIVGLGKEVAVEAWLEEWNKLRKQGNVPNKIEVIELRSDPKYGGFFTHEPAKAKVTFKREKVMWKSRLMISSPPQSWND